VPVPREPRLVALSLRWLHSPELTDEARMSSASTARCQNWRASSGKLRIYQGHIIATDAQN
jgi:hypothetical protein